MYVCPTISENEQGRLVNKWQVVLVKAFGIATKPYCSSLEL